MSDEEKNNEELHDEDHSAHDFDGIKELDNKAPTWIIILFLVTIGFSGIYAIHYFGYPDNGMDQTSEYNREVAEYNEEKAAMQSKTGGSENSSIEEMAAAGDKLYHDKGCIACHGMNGEGNSIGPNLTDKYWLNGCTDEEIIHTITEGKPEKGMTPYKAMMSENQIKEVTVFIKNTLIGSNPENGKDPQGEECAGL